MRQLWSRPTPTVVRGNLADQEVDVLVSSIGTSAKLIEGSVAYAILEKGGYDLQFEIDKLFPNGMKVGEMARTGGGFMKCKKVLFFPLYQWENVGDKAEHLLKTKLTECLEWAAKEGFTSIAFPAMGIGFHRFPAKRSAEIMFDTIQTFLRTGNKRYLKTAKIVLHPRDTPSTTTEFMAQKGGIATVQKNYRIKTIILPHQTPTGKGSSIEVIVGCLSEQMADVLVNTTQSDLQLSIGAVSRSLVEKGGSVLQKECSQQHPRGITPGQIVQTNGGDLPCQKVIHVVLSLWDADKGNAEKTLKLVVKTCLQRTSDQGYTSIAFPVLGTGYLKFPPSQSAKFMMEAFTEFIQQTPKVSIQTISVVVAQKDTFIIKEIVENFRQKGDTAAGLLPGESEAYAANEVWYYPIKAGNYARHSEDEKHFDKAKSAFFKSLLDDDNNRHIFKLTKVEYVVNPALNAEFIAAQMDMAEADASYETPTLGFHGTPEKNVKSICRDGFRLPNHEQFEKSTDIGWYGNGIYLSGSARFAMNYMKKSKMLILCNVLQGKVFKCEDRKIGEAKQPGYDSHVDPYGKEMVIYDNNCILPLYIVHFEITKRFKRNGDTYDPNENDTTEFEFLNELEMHKGEKVPGV